MENIVYNGMCRTELPGIFNEEIAEKLGINLEHAKKHSVMTLSTYSKIDLYKTPPPYSEILVIYRNLDPFSEIAPNGCFSEEEIERYDLTPVGENELPSVISCEWVAGLDFHRRPFKTFYINFFYNRKNDSKYRLRFLMNPHFNPRD